MRIWNERIQTFKKIYETYTLGNRFSLKKASNAGNEVNLLMKTYSNKDWTDFYE